MQAKLIVASGKNASRSVDVAPGIHLIGRGEQCHFRPTSLSVSRCHCALICAHDRIWLQDMESQSGTFVNEIALPPDRKRLLSDGDAIRIGTAKFKIQIEESVDENEIANVLTELDHADRKRTDEAHSPSKIDSGGDTTIDAIDTAESETLPVKQPVASGRPSAKVRKSKSKTISAAEAGLNQIRGKNLPNPNLDRKFKAQPSAASQRAAQAKADARTKAADDELDSNSDTISTEPAAEPQNPVQRILSFLKPTGSN